MHGDTTDMCDLCVWFGDLGVAQQFSYPFISSRTLALQYLNFLNFGTHFP